MADITPKEQQVEAVETTPVKAEKPAPTRVKPVEESVYTAEDLANNHKAFKTSREIVVVALRLAGKKTATLTEAKNIIEKFKNKEVK